MSYLDADLWQEAINKEIDSLESNNTWHLVDLHFGCKSIDCKWILKTKLKSDRTVDKYKALLVAKKFSQRQIWISSIFFSLDTIITFISILISIGTIYNLIVHKIRY